MLFESSWDTKSSNEALVRNAAPSGKPKSEKKTPRDSSTKVEERTDGGANIDLDKLLKKMTNIAGGDVKGKGNSKGKGKGRRKEKEEGGQKAKLKDGAAKAGKESKESKEVTAPPKPKTGEKQDGGAKGRKKKERRDAPEPAVGEKRKADEGEDGSKAKSKKQKKERAQEGQKRVSTDPAEPAATEVEEESPEEMSELQKLMKKNMQGSKFRIINEKLYKSSSRDAQTMMRSEPQTFTEASLTNIQNELHSYSLHQTKSWPTNPIDLISTSLSSLPPRSIIVDLGCGDAQLAKTLVPQGLNVLSFDLLSDNKWVVEADICTRIPLPGSEDNESQGAIADACVCSLSLMSTNWIECAREAWRVLRMGGRFVVAEVTSRFRDSKEFCKVLSELGFDSVEQNAPSTHFLLFEFRKVEREEDIQTSWTAIQSSAEGLLKPCEYKRR